MEGQIAILYVCGFASAVLLGPPAALLVDRLGRRASCVLFSLSCAACCLTKLSRDYLVLAAGRVLGGLATALTCPVQTCSQLGLLAAWEASPSAPSLLMESGAKSHCVRLSCLKRKRSVRTAS